MAELLTFSRAAKVAPWGWGWIKRRVIDRQALVEAGAAVVTPVIDLTGRVGPTGASVGTAEEIQQRIRGWEADWDAARGSLMTYANGHPSESVRRSAHELSDAVDSAFRATLYFSLRFNSADVLTAYNGARDAQGRAKELATSLMDAIRAY